MFRIAYCVIWRNKANLRETIGMNSWLISKTKPICQTAKGRNYCAQKGLWRNIRFRWHKTKPICRASPENPKLECRSLCPLWLQRNLQNKANLRSYQINVNSSKWKDYREMPRFRGRKNKANLPAFGRKSEAPIWKPWIPHRVRNDRGWAIMRWLSAVHLRKTNPVPRKRM